MITEKELVRKSNLMESIKQGIGGTKEQKREAVKALDELIGEFSGDPWSSKRCFRKNEPGSRNAVGAVENSRIHQLRAELKGLEAVPQTGQDVAAIQGKITDVTLRIAMESALQAPKVQ
jgi:hypothetical protein